MNTPKSALIFLRVFTYISLLLGLPLLLNVIFITRAFENESYKNIVVTQLKKDCLYASAINPNELGYKLALVNEIKPEVIIIGSSRSLTFRKEAFKKKFVNAGGTFGSLAEGERFLTSLLSNQQPKVIFWPLDYWWFNKRYVFWNEGRDQIPENQINQQKLIDPFVWLYDKKISFSQYSEISLGNLEQLKTYGHSVLGIAALTKGYGFRPDGSLGYFKASQVESTKRLNDLTNNGFNPEIEDRVFLGCGEFVDEAKWQQFLKLVELIKHKNILLWMWLPPIMPSDYSKIIQVHQTNFLQALEAKFNHEGFKIISYNENDRINLRDVEYLDTWHHGEKTALKILLDLLRHDETADLKLYLDEEKLIKKIQTSENDLVLD